MLRVKSRMNIAQKIRPAALALAFAMISFRAPAAEPARVTENFDANWLFLKADATNAEQIQFDDSGWRKLNLPHDWSIEGPFAETNKTGGAGAFLPGGVAGIGNISRCRRMTPANAWPSSSTA